MGQPSDRLFAIASELAWVVEPILGTQPNQNDGTQNNPEQ